MAKAADNKNMEQEIKRRGKELMSWEVRPYLQEKRKTAILIISTFLFSALVWYAFDLFAGILAFAVSIGSFSSFLFPNHYRLYEKGLEVKTGINAPVFRRWTAFKDYRIFHDGVHLNYHPRRMRERLLKSQFVYFGDADAEAIKRIITENMDALYD
ncbi:MAG: hypothetical protein GX033_05540 [Firmicutes bacterium]|nr:hypothetical protein [Bacillota bacterium]